MKKLEDLLKKNRLSSTQLIALSFLAVIGIGTGLLLLPWATKPGESTSLLQAAFTAVSATCVTGLIVVDTFSHWTIFGQLVILVMIQIGGLGFMTVTVWFSFLMKRKIGLKERGLLQESVNTLQIGGIVKLVRKILLGTLFIEGAGAVILSLRFVREFGPGKGIYYGIFHSISAFCNAGFDLMGTRAAFSSLTAYAGDVVVNLTVMLLIIIGGIGFLVWDDLLTNRLHFRKYRLHTKIVLVTTGILIFGGALLFSLFEWNNSLSSAPLAVKLLGPLFQSVTCRTAGFNTLDTGSLTEGTKLMMSSLMFIGGSPGSTAGGIKTTTIAVMFFYLRSTLLKEKGASVFGRRLEESAVKRAGGILFLSLSMDVAAALALLAIEGAPLANVMFEVFSALGTVGITAGLTPGLSVASKLILMVMMYCGRLGSLTFALIFTENRQNSLLQQPTEKIIIG